MGMPGKRFWNLGGRVYDSHLMPKGWFSSSKEEREAAVVYFEPRYHVFTAMVEAGRHIRNVVVELNEGRRVVHKSTEAAEERYESDEPIDED